MNTDRIYFADVTIDLPDNWADMTEDLPEGSPYTLSRAFDGLGVLQFSVAYYKGGVEPDFDSDALESLLNEFFLAKGFGKPLGLVRWHDDAVMGLGAHCFLDEEYFRIWYVTDGMNIAFLTYTSLQAENQLTMEEANEAEDIVKSIRFEKEPL